MDEETRPKVVDLMDRNDPKKTKKPFFVWYNPARMHITTMLPDKYMATSRREGARHRQADRRVVLGRQHLPGKDLTRLG